MDFSTGFNPGQQPRFPCGESFLGSWLADGDDLICGNVAELLNDPAWPNDFKKPNDLFLTQAEMNSLIVGGQVAPGSAHKGMLLAP